MEVEVKDEMRLVGERVRNYILKESGDEGSVVIVDVAVFFDGIWVKRGFIFLIGIVFVIVVDIGEVLDYYVFLKECYKCLIKKS